jgi:hypothetical protein
VVLTRDLMSASDPPNSETVRELLRKTAELTRRLAELGARGTAAAAALTKPGAPPPDTLVHELAEARQAFTTLRDEAFAAAAALGLPLPDAEAVDSTKRLEPLLQLLRDGLEAAEREARDNVALTRAVGILDRIAGLAHREDPAFAALAACQSRAADVRGALAASGKVDPNATAPFAALLLLMDRQQKLSDEQWGALEDSVAAAFGRALAVAATRGKLLAR